jgi:hypothetical protein
VLDALRGRAAAGRSLLDSARRTLTELGMRHALLEVDQFAGILELVADDPAAAEPLLRRAYNGFRRMGLDADTAETAALLGRACLALDRDAEADELCTESEHLAGHALKASIAWRTVRAQLLARSGNHSEARRMAEEAVALAARTDLLVDHGDACLALASVLQIADDAAGARAAAERAVGLYELKGAAALAELARKLLGVTNVSAPPAPIEPPIVEPDTACVRVGKRALDAIARAAWDEYQQLFAHEVFVESRRKIGRFTQIDVPTGDWPGEARRNAETGGMRPTQVVIAVRGERLALGRLELDTEDTSPGAPHDELLHLFGIDEDGRIVLQMWFEVEDIDAAIAELDAAHARLEELQPRAPFENSASRVDDRCYALFADGRTEEIGALLADDHFNEDRRQGLRRESNNRAAAIENIRAIAALGVNITKTPLALRGDRLCLSHILFERSEAQPDAFSVETLEVAEVDTDGVLVARVVLDPDDVEAAFAELDARYLVGEAAPHAQAWQMVNDGLAALNRHEPLPTAWGDVSYADHRRVPFAPGDFERAMTELWTLVPDARYRTKAVHALDAHGGVASLVIEGTDAHGGELQWVRIVLISFARGQARVEIYEEEDLAPAVARFEELRPRTRRLENAASQVYDRLIAHFASRDWDALAEAMADNCYTDDRRRVVGAGVRHGPDAAIEDSRAIADVGFTNMSLTVIATRGQRLALTRAYYSGCDQGPEAFQAESLGIVEINADERIAAIVVFELDDFDAAIAELDSRYLAGEAAAHARTWSVITDGYAALNRHELPAMTPDCASIDHRRVAAFAPGEVIAYARAGLDLDQNIRTYVEAVHRLNDLGVVWTHVGHETSQDGFDAEWRIAFICTVEGDLVSRCEVFDEADLDTALAKFDQLSRPAPRLENAASRVAERMVAHFAARDWNALAELFAEDYYCDDRRLVVNAGVRHGRAAAIEDFQVAGDVGLLANVTLSVIATRGERLILNRWCASGREPEAVQVDVLQVIEYADERIAAAVVFDLDDIDAAFEELEARYLAGEAAAHAQTWSVIAGVYAAFNRREHPGTTQDSVIVDHRRLGTVEADVLSATIDAIWDLTPDLKIHTEAVHRLSTLGAVVTNAGRGTSQDGFEAEWRTIFLFAVEGELLSRCEIFDEVDIDAAAARFDELSPLAPQLENAASRAYDRFNAYLAARDWDAMADMVTDDICNDDRRRVVSGGVQRGRDAQTANLRAVVDVGVKNFESVVIATRGQRLALSRTRVSGGGQRAEAFGLELLTIIEIDTDNRIAAGIQFDLDDIDAAFAELDARYLAGEAAAHAHTWSVIANAYNLFNRRELFPTTPDWVNVDHRRGTSVAPDDLKAFIRASWADTPNSRIYIEAVHRLTEFGAVATSASHGSSQDGFEAEWREIGVTTVDGEMISRTELFDEAGLDAALAEFDELSRPVPRLENAASQVYERFLASFGADDWDAISEMLAEDILNDDRRRVVSAGVRQGRDATIASMRAIADLGRFVNSSTVVATRGGRLVLSRERFSVEGERPDAVLAEVLGIVEIGAEGRIVARVVFDPDDIDAAFAELDSRYLAGEAAVHAQTWTLIARVFAAINRRELPELTPDWVNIDHRRGIAFEPGDMTAYIRAIWDDTPDVNVYIEAVHRLSDLGAVVTQAATGTSQQGFAAEWRAINISTVDGGLIHRCELFDETDIDAALARFAELHPQAPRLENAASRVFERFQAYFADRDWTAMAEILGESMCNDDRRRVVGAGVLHGRDTDITHMRAIADVGVTTITSTAIATRGERLVLRRVVFGEHGGPEAFLAELLGIVEIDADNRIVARLSFDADDLDAAFEELDSRYLAGEAAAHTHTWSVVVEAFAAVNRHELPGLTPDWANIDHRRASAFAPGDMAAYTQATFEQLPDATFYVEAVHRLSDLGAVVTQAAHGTSQEGFEAEWREIGILIVEGDLLGRYELFDEADIDAALARFDILNRPAPRLDNAASRMDERLKASFAARDWAATHEILAEDTSNDDRRRVVGAGPLHGRELNIADLQAIANVGTTVVTSTVIATRHERLALSRYRFSGRDPRPEAFHADMFGVVEINAENRIAARVWFDLDDLDAAFEELDARYLLGEAAAHSQTWSVTKSAYAAFNRRELPPTTPDWVNIDHRRGTAFAPGDAIPYIRSAWDVAPDINIHIQAVHRLSNLGAVVTFAAHGTSEDGFHAEWREITALTFEADLLNRCELFDEADLDAALAGFEELDRPAPRLENAASQVKARFWAKFAARDWDPLAEILADDALSDDRRRVVSAGIRRGRDAAIANWRTIADFGDVAFTLTVVATRGERLALSRDFFSVRGRQLDAEMLGVVEVDAHERIVAHVVFDVDDVDAALAELDARYLAGEAAEHSRTWSVIAKNYAGLNRHEVPPMTSDWVNVDHRRVTTIAPGELIANLSAAWDLTPQARFYIETVHRLTDLGAVVTLAMSGISQEGFEAEWRLIDLMTFEGDLMNRSELFDEADLDTALARFDELDRPTPPLENAATRTWALLADAFNRRDVDGFLAFSTADGRFEDRRKGLRAVLEGPERRAAVHAVFGEAPNSWRMEVEPIAIRGSRLSLTRECYRDIDDADRPIAVELLNVTEVSAGDLMQDITAFDPDDIDAAFEELTSRWIASGEVAHPEVIEAERRLIEAVNRHDWDAIAIRFAGATIANHRQLANPDAGTIADHMSSLRTMASLVPNFWVEVAEVLKHSAKGVVTYSVSKGSSSDGVAIEIPVYAITLLDGDRVTRFEAFDADQRDLAVARFDELNGPA